MDGYPVKVEINEYISGKPYRCYNEVSEKMFREREGLDWCNANKDASQKGIPFFLLKKRCAYVADVIQPVSPKCSELCLEASKSKDWTPFSNLCIKASAMWEVEARQKIEKRNLEIGVV